MRRSILCTAVFLTLSLPLAAQTITTDAVSSNILCGGSSVTVDFTATGSFVQGNAFTLQLSDASGGFGTSFRNLTSITATTSGSITVQVPNNLDGSGYRFRVIGSNPPVTGTDNGTDIMIAPTPEISVGRKDGARSTIMVGDSIWFASNAPNGMKYVWDFGSGANPPISKDAEPGPVTYSTPGERIVTLTVTNAAGCTSVGTMKSGAAGLSPAVKAGDFIVQSDTATESDAGGSRFSGSVWVCPGATFLDGASFYRPILVERGGSVISNYFGDIVYLKSGAMIFIGDSEWPGVIVHEPGAAIHYSDSYHGSVRVIEVPSLTFDYTNAPPGGCPSLARYTKKIPSHVHSVVKPTTADDSYAEFWIRDGGELTALGGRNTYSIETGTVTALGDSCIVYLKKGGTFNAGGSKGHRIFHEVEATIINAGDGSVLLPSDSLTFVPPGVSGIDEIISTGAADGMTASPNPAFSSVTIGMKDPSTEIQRIVIRNIQGEIVIERDIDRVGSVSVSVEDLASGVYHIEAETSRGRTVQSIIVAR